MNLSMNDIKLLETFIGCEYKPGHVLYSIAIKSNEVLAGINIPKSGTTYYMEVEDVLNTFRAVAYSSVLKDLISVRIMLKRLNSKHLETLEKLTEKIKDELPNSTSY